MKLFISETLLIILFSIVSKAYAQKEPHYKMDSTKFSLSMKDLCSDIYNRRNDIDEKSNFGYLYERDLWEMAGADPDKDDTTTAIKKIQVFWTKNKTKCTCDVIGFPLSRGNILKFAVNYNLVEFIQDLAGVYHLDINFLDPVDGKTVLDFTADLITKLKNKNIDNKAEIAGYQKIYKTLKEKYGALHSYELHGK
jgi:hypothetical protein